MPPAAKKNYGVILYDVNASNKDDALVALLKIYTYKWLSTSKDTFKFILSNTKASRNAGGYKNLYDTNITSLDPQLILNCVEQAEAEEGDFLDALLLGIHHAKESYELPGIITLQILYITTLDGCSQNFDKKKVSKIINDLREYNIFLYIIGPNIKLPYTLTSEDDVREAMKEINVDDSIAALPIAKKIVSKTENSIICNLKVGINLFFSFKNPIGTQPWKVPLSFGSKLEIPVSTVKIYRKDVPFKLTAEQQKASFVLQEDESVTVAYDDLIRGIVRHGKFVKMEDNEMFKISGPRSFSVLGFTSKENVPEIYMHGAGCYLVLPDPDKTADGCQAVYNLVDVLAEQDKYAIVRRVYNANNKPKFCVLVPQPHLVPKCFVMSELPYADDVRDTKYKFQDLESVNVATGSADGKCQEFFKSIDIYDKDCKVNVPLSPMLMMDGYTSKLANEVMKKYLEREFDFDNVEINLMEEESNEFMDALMESWPQNTSKADGEGGDGDDDEYI